MRPVNSFGPLWNRKGTLTRNRFANVCFGRRVLESPDSQVNMQRLHMGVSQDRGTSKWMIYNGNPYLKWMIWGTTIFGNTHIHCLLELWMFVIDLNKQFVCNRAWEFNMESGNTPWKIIFPTFICRFYVRLRGCRHVTCSVPVIQEMSCK